MQKKKSLPLGECYRLLETGPVVLITTSQKGKANVMTQSWHLMMEFEPPLIGVIVSNRNHSFAALKSTKECVINIPEINLKNAIVGCGNNSGKNTDKFKKYKLTPQKASLVTPPLIKECYANLECKVVDSHLVNKYNFFVLQVVKAWGNPKVKNPKTLHHRGRGYFMVAGPTVKLRSKAK